MGLGFLSALSWSPNPCRECTPEDRFALEHERGSGKSLDGSVCRHCRGTGYGPQLDILLSVADESFVGGPKGWGKSAGCQAWMLSGNPSEPDGPLRKVTIKHRGQPPRDIITGGIHYSYVFQPDFLALVTRKSEDDLKPWLESFRPFAERMGGRFIDRPDYMFRFPDESGRIDEGGVIAFSHMRNPASYEKFQGSPQLQRWQPEELAQLAEESVYEDMLGCMRAKDGRPFRVQMMGTANPEGDGLVWVANRFVDIRDHEGNKIPPGVLVSDVRYNELTGEHSTRTRIYITGSLLDNPKLDRRRYAATLNAISDPRKRRAVLLGDWSYAVGNFFPEFRYERIEGEPDNACHVYDPSTVNLRPWWRRGIGVDWGYAHNAVANFGCEDPSTGRFYIEKELVVRQTGARKLGAMIAQEALPLIEASPRSTIPLFLSHDAYQRKNDEGGVTRIASLIEMGIKSVLGETAVSGPSLKIAELADAAGLEYTEFMAKHIEVCKEIEAARHYGIVIFRAQMINQGNWALMHDMMRWDMDLMAEIPEFDWKTWQRLGQTHGALEATKYLHMFDPKEIVRPELQISNICRNVIRGFRGARSNEKLPERISDRHYEGRDSLDAAAHLLAGMALSRREEELPREERRAQRVDQFYASNPSATIGDLHQASEFWEQQGFDRQESSAIYGRLGSRSSRRLAARGSLSGRIH